MNGATRRQLSLRSGNACDPGADRGLSRLRQPAARIMHCEGGNARGAIMAQRHSKSPKE